MEFEHGTSLSDPRPHQTTTTIKKSGQASTNRNEKLLEWEKCHRTGKWEMREKFSAQVVILRLQRNNGDFLSDFEQKFQLGCRKYMQRGTLFWNVQVPSKSTCKKSTTPKSPLYDVFRCCETKLFEENLWYPRLCILFWHQEIPRTPRCPSENSSAMMLEKKLQYSQKIVIPPPPKKVSDTRNFWEQKKVVPGQFFQWGKKVFDSFASDPTHGHYQLWAALTIFSS